MKTKIRRILICLFCISCMIMPILAADAGMENFVFGRSYYEGRFTDVHANDWFSDEVATAYQLGLADGKSATTFDPNGNIRRSEAITLACRLHSIYCGDQMVFTQGTPWYQVYVDYAVQNGIISQNQFSDYTAYTTRAEFASIFAAALPESALPAVNSVDRIPDVPQDSAYAAPVYLLYRAGILTGNDAKGTFAPNSMIRRCEVAVIASRMALPAMRAAFTLSSTVQSTGSSSESSTPASTTGSTTYIGNMNTKKFHYDWCASVKRMNESNKYYHTGTRAEIIAMGYTPCNNCNP